MSEAMLYGPITDTDLSAVTRLIVHAFAGTAEGTQDWLKTTGPEHVRVVRAGPSPGAPPQACLLRIPMGQYFGGRAVSMLGIAGVGVAPESRGKGYAKILMQEAVREAARDGYALSALYPSTQSLYRSVGYEQAGHRMTARLPIAQIEVWDREAEVVPLGEEDWPAIKACYASFAARFDGMLERGPYVWGRIPKWHDQKFIGFGVRNGDDGLDGYVFLAQKRKESARQEITVQDFAFTTPSAGRRLLRFFADFGTMGDDVVFSAGPAHPALLLLPLQKYKLEFNYYWMVRVLGVAKALGERGYPPGVRAEIHLDIADGLVPENGGRWLLRVADGRGEAVRGGLGHVKTDARGLAALYTGHLGAEGLALAGLLAGDEGAIRALGAVFAGGAPWMTDFF